MELNDQEIEDLKQLVYEKVKALDSDTESSIGNSRKGNLTNRLNAFYERLSNGQYLTTKQQQQI